MQLHELKEQLIKEKLNSLYIFTGEEIAIKDIYIKKIAEILKADIVRADSVSAIFNKMQVKSFVDKPKCFVIWEDKEFQKEERIWKDFKSGKAQNGNVIILIYEKIDKRSKFYKQNDITEFEKLIPEILAKYIYKDIGLDTQFGLELAERCSRDYSKILLECNKLNILAKVRGVEIEQAYLMAVKEKLIHESPQDVIFDLIDAICKRQIKQVYQLHEELKQLNENSLGIISLLYVNMKNMLLVQSAKSSPDIANTTGLTAWQIKLAKEKGNNYSTGELVRAIRVIRETEKGIKTGLIEQVSAVDYILVRIL